MTRKLIALSLAASTLAFAVAAPISIRRKPNGAVPMVTAATAYGHGGYGYGRGYGYRGVGPGAIVGGALLGLGVGALLAAPYVAPPPVVYAPPPPAYYPPPYAYAPYRYAPPPPAYYAPY